MSERTVDEINTDERLDALERWQHEMDAKFIAAFPDGNHAGHRAYHELMIEESRDRKKLIAAVKEKTIAGLVWAGMLGIGLACWKYFIGMIKVGG